MKHTLFVLLTVISINLWGESIHRIQNRIEIRKLQLNEIISSIPHSDDQYVPGIIKEYLHRGIDSDTYALELEDGADKKALLALKYLNEIYININQIRNIKIENGFKKLYKDSGIDENLRDYLQETQLINSELLDIYHSRFIENGGTVGYSLNHLKYLGYGEDEFNYSLKIKHKDESIRFRIKTHLLFNNLGKNSLEKKSGDIKIWSQLLLEMELWDIIPMLLADKNMESTIKTLNSYIADKKSSPVSSLTDREFILLRDKIRVISYWINTEEFYFFKEVINE